MVGYTTFNTVMARWSTSLNLLKMTPFHRDDKRCKAHEKLGVVLMPWFLVARINPWIIF